MTHISREKNRIFNTLLFVGLFLAGTLIFFPLLSEWALYWLIFERKLVELAVFFAGSKFQRITNWPSFDFWSKQSELQESGRSFVYCSLWLFRFFLSKLNHSKTVGHPLEFEPAKKNRPIPLYLLENRLIPLYSLRLLRSIIINRFLSKIDQWVVAHWGSRRHFLTSPEKKPAKEVLKKNPVLFFLQR